MPLPMPRPIPPVTWVALPARMEAALDALAQKKNWTSDQKAAARQWLEGLLTHAKNTPTPGGADKCWKWAQAALAYPSPPPPNAKINARLRSWYYPHIWSPFRGYLTHAAVEIQIGDAVFYVDGGWWANRGEVYGPEKISPNVKPLDLTNPPPDPLWYRHWYQSWRFQRNLTSPRFPSRF